MYYFKVYELLERRIHALGTKVSNRYFCWFPAAVLVPNQMDTTMASPYKALYKYIPGFLKTG